MSVSEVKNIADGKKDAADVRDRLENMYDTFDIDGSLEIRDGFPKNRACCFRGCRTPKSWGIQKPSWCYDKHLRVSVGL